MSSLLSTDPLPLPPSRGEKLPQLTEAEVLTRSGSAHVYVTASLLFATRTARDRGAAAETIVCYTGGYMSHRSVATRTTAPELADSGRYWVEEKEATALLVTVNSRRHI